MALEFAQRGVRVTVLTTVSAVHSVPVGVSVASLVRDWTWRTLPRILVLLLRLRPDAVLLLYLGTMYDHHPMITYVPTLVRWLQPGVPCVTQFEKLRMGDTPSRLARFGRKVVRWVLGATTTDYDYGTLLRDSNRVIVLCERHRIALSRARPSSASKMMLIPPAPLMCISSSENARERELDRKSIGLSESDFAFCYYGFIYPGKGMDTMLAAFQAVSERYASATLVIIGGFAQHSFDSAFAERSRSYEASIRQLASQPKLAARIKWLGYCPPTDPLGSRYMRACDCFVLPLDRGVCLNNSALGAGASHGLPILSTVGPDTDSVLVRDGLISLSPPRNAKSLGDEMGRVLTNPEYRSQLAAGAVRLAAQWYDWESSIHRIAFTLWGPAA